MSSKDTGLVVFTPGVEGNKFNDVVIDGVTAYNTTQWSGILVGKGTGADAWAPNAANRSTNVTVRNSTVHDVYGDGIILFIVNSGLLENNVAYRTGLEPTQSIGTPNGIWTWACKDCVVQNNEAYQNFTPGTIDGGGFDIDYFTENNTVQFNYAHDNEGYCFATYSRTSSPTRNAVFRYNLCANNGQGLGAQGEIRVYADSGFDGVQIYNNTVYANLSADAAAIQNNGSFSGSRPNFIKNNIVYSTRPKLISSNTAMALNNNLYWYTGTGNPTWRYNSVDYTSIASYRTGSAQESASLYKNPRLNQPTSHPTGRPATAYTLLPDSPAINAGADVCAGLTGCSAGSRDYYGNAAPAGGAYDIGAYEGPGVDGPVDPLLTNGGFESASAGQWNLRGTTSIVSGNASSGQKALSVAGTTAGAYITLGGLSPDTTYTFAGQLKSSTSGSKAYLYAKSFGRTDVRSLLHDNVNYTPTSISFTTGPSATSAEIGVWRDSVHGSGTVYADEFTLKPNLVTNPGFESNSLSPWTVQNATIGSDARTGSRALSVGGSSAGAWHKVSGLSPNTTYTFRAHLKSQAASDGAYLYAKNFGGTEVRSSTYTGTAYGPVTVTFTTGSSQYSAEVGIWRGSGMGTGSVSADDFELF
jgi:hypothetical protein